MCTLFCLLFLCYTINLQAQGPSGERYQSIVFPQYDSVLNIKYGSNVTASSATPQDLLLDIYMPSGDALSHRPVIFFAHGGHFLTGNKESPESVYFCREFVKRGYVTVSINYRLGFETFDSIGAARAVWRATQDARAAVRFMRSQSETYKLDTNAFVFAGTSAGGFLALNVAYLDRGSETPNNVDTSDYVAPNGKGLDGLEGTTNLLTNSSRVQAVISLCGAIGSTNWIEAKDSTIAALNMHGTADDIVPYGTDIIKLLGSIPLVEVSGGSGIRKRLNDLQIDNRFFTYCGGGHVPFDPANPMGKDWLDSTLSLMIQFTYENVLKLGLANIRISDIDSSDCPGSTFVPSNLISMKELTVYPNPSSGTVYIRFAQEPLHTPKVYIIDPLGKKETLEVKGSGSLFSIDISHIGRGTYILLIESDKEVLMKKLVVN